jgi:hypothetical protein
MWYKYYYYMGDFMLALMFLRIRFVFKLMTNWSMYSNAFSKYVSQLYGFRSNQMFTFKCYFEMYPGRIFGTIFLSSVLIMSYVLRIAELPLVRPEFNNYNDSLQNFGEAVYLVIMTITTVGYGDLVPYSTAGKIVAMIASLWGSLLVSLLVVTQMTIFELNDNQRKALTHINMSKSAADTINRSIKYFLVKKRFFIETMKYHPVLA